MLVTPMVVMQPAQPLPQLLTHLGVEGPEWLIEQQHARLGGQGPGQGHALPLTAGKLAGIARLLLLQADQMQQLADAHLHLVIGPAAHTQAEGDVFEHRHVAKQGVVLEDEADVAFAGRVIGDVLIVIMNRAAIGRFQPRDDPQQRRLAAAGRPQQGQQAAGGNLDADAVQGGELAETLADFLDMNAHERSVTNY